MNFQGLVDSISAPTCVISVEKSADGYGDIRLVTGNQTYLEPIEHPSVSLEDGKPTEFRNQFIPNSLYERYLPKDLGFEDICFRCAVHKKPIHTYVHMNYLDLWFDIFAMPIDYEDGNTCYCTYTAVPASPEEVGISSGYSNRATEDVLKTCIKLHGTNDFKSTMEDVIKDIRLICRAEVCTILLIDEAEEKFSILATSFENHSTIRHVTSFPSFYEIVESWISMTADRECVIIRNDKDLDYIGEINHGWYVTLVDAGVNSVVLFPLRHNQEILGFIWATNFDTNDTMRIKETLELTTFFISSQIASYKMVKRLKHISYTDRLTELPNRFACIEDVDAYIRKGEPFAIASIDINNFKSINDTMGFDTGNKVLTEIAERWKKVAAGSASGTKDGVYRLGGDEFALLLCGCHEDREIMQTLRQYEAELGDRLTIDGCDFYITASFGYAVFPEDAQNIDALLSHAGAAMQEVKRVNSSNRILRFSQEYSRMERTMEIEGKIRTALEQDTFYFNLQPQYNMDHRLRGFEALARMRDEDGSVISPGEFIPVAEKVGLIDKVDSAVFRKSAAFIGALIRETGTDITLSVNVSVRHLMKNEFLDEVREILHTSRIPAEQLEIEITESIMIDSADKALQCINELRNMGIKLAIDDFGTGYSSLSYLNKFPANLLKIDKSFIDKMNTSESSKQYVAAIISLGHIMGFDVISEGVEEEEQLETLRSIGCDYIQGYIWGKPLMPDAAEEIIRASIK